MSAKVKTTNPNQHKRTDAQRAEDLAIISSMLLMGRYGYREIAKHISSIRSYSISFQQVGYDAKQLMQEWHEQALQNIDTIKARELENINRVQREAFTAWEASKKGTNRVRMTGKAKKGKESPTTDRVEQTKEDSAGDPRYLQVINDCIQLRLKIYGAVAPVKTAYTDVAGEPVAPIVPLASTPEVHIYIPANNRDMRQANAIDTDSTTAQLPDSRG